MEAQAVQSPPVVEEHLEPIPVALVRQGPGVWRAIGRAIIILVAVGVGLFLALTAAFFLGLIPIC